MSLPSALTSAGYAKTIREIREKLEARITNQTNRLSATPSYHRGRAHPSALPDEPLGIWLDWDEVRGDPEGGTFGAGSYESVWLIQIVVRDDSQDNWGNNASDLGEQIWGDILQSLTENATDLSLDGTIDYFPDPTTRHMRGTPTIRGGSVDRRIEYFELELVAKHQMEIVRVTPPP